MGICVRNIEPSINRVISKVLLILLLALLMLHRTGGNERKDLQSSARTIRN